MTRKQRKALERAYVLIENNKRFCICGSLPFGITLYNIPEAQAFNPGTDYWWGDYTMGIAPQSSEALSARLLGLAFMLTMPKDMIP